MYQVPNLGVMLRLRSHKVASNVTLHSCWGLSGLERVSRDILSTFLIVTLISGQRPREDPSAGGYSWAQNGGYLQSTCCVQGGEAAQLPSKPQRVPNGLPDGSPGPDAPSQAFPSLPDPLLPKSRLSVS